MISYIDKLRWIPLITIAAWLVIGPAEVCAQGYVLNFSPDQGVWDVTGHYSNDEFDTTNSIDLVQDDKGKITGTGTATASDSGITVNLVYNFTGAIKTSNDLTRAALTMKISGSATDGSITLPVTGSIKMTLDLDKVNNVLIGSGKGKVCVQGRCVPVDGPVQFEIPEPMDGGWTLVLDLQNLEGRVGGAANAILSNGRALPLIATGTFSTLKRPAHVNLKGPAGTITLIGDPYSLGLLFSKAKLLGQTVPTSP